MFFCKPYYTFCPFFLVNKDGEDTQVEDTSRIDPPFLNSSSGGQVAGMYNIS